MAAVLQAQSWHAAPPLRRCAGRAIRGLARAVLCAALFAVLGTAMPHETGDRAVVLAADRPAADAEGLTLDVLTWNVQLRPFVPEGKRWRTPLMAERLRGYDVVLLQEAFSDAHRKLLLHRLADDIPIARGYWAATAGSARTGAS